jgi:dihydrofolate reductase
MADRAGDPGGQMNRPRCSSFLAVSADGFVARPDGSLDWLDAARDGAPEGEDFGYGAFASTVDVLAMGRATFGTVLGFGEWPYGDLPVVVLSSTMARLPAGTPETVSLSNESPVALLSRLGAAGRRHVYVDGGQTVRRFLEAGVLDELTLTTVPVLLGDGRPLFVAGGPERRLAHVATRSWPIGFVQTTWRVVGGTIAAPFDGSRPRAASA